MENIIYLSLLIIISILFFVIVYLLKVHIRIKRDIEVIKEEMDITSAIFEVNFDNYKTKYKRKASQIKNLRENDEKKQLSLDIFLNS